ncbi:MAG: autotransporter-associated beta strand repeat-containing protein [Verrucomicrobia bacterium]|nr:autotransporter-associated beta strand repeat-containing protein [Verrucomicrobiota bacterium]
MKSKSMLRLVRTGSRAACLLACSIAALLAASARADTNVLIADDFNNNAIDGTKWTTTNPSSTNSTNGETAQPNGYLFSKNRANILTASAASWDPANATYGGQHLTGIFYMAADSNRNQGDTVDIYTRSSSANGGGVPVATSFGIGFSLGEQGKTVGLGVSGYANAWAQEPAAVGEMYQGSGSASGTTNNNYQQAISYDIWDFGDGRYAGTFTQMAGANAGMTSTVTGISTTTGTYASQVNQVNMHSRERSNGAVNHHQTNFDDTVVSAPSSWSGTDGSSWSGTNWTGGNGVTTHPSGNGTSVIFGKAGSVGTVDLDADTSVGAIAFYPDVNTSIATSNGSTLTLDNRPLTASTGTGSVDTGALAGITVLGGTHTVNTAITLQTSAVVTVLNSTDSLTLDGTISGTGYANLYALNLTTSTGGNGLTKGGAGTLVLPVANTYGGATRLALGTLTVGHQLALENSTLDTLISSTTRTLGFGSGITAPTFGGLAGSLSVALLDADNNGVALTVGGNNSTTNYGGSLSDAGGATTGSLTKVGTGTLTLTAVNTYTGPTTIAGGTLALGVGGAVSSSPTIAVADGATFSVAALGAGYHLLGTQTLTGNGNFSVTGTLTVDGGATVLPGGSGGVGTLSVGSLTLNPDSILKYDFDSGVNDLISVTTGSGLTLSGGGLELYQTDGVTPFTTPGTYNLIQYTGTFSGSISNLTVLNPDAGRSYIFAASGGYITLTIASLEQIWTGGGGAPFTWGTNANWSSLLAPTNGKPLTFAGSIGLANTNNIPAFLDVAGMAFTGSAGPFSLSGNSILLSGGISNSSTATQTIGLGMALVGGNQSLNALAGNIVVTGTISDGDGSRGIVKTGASTLTLTANNSYSGGTILDDGTLQVNHNSALGSGPLTFNAGTLSSGGIGSFALTNALMLAASVPLGDATNNGTLTFNGPVTLGVSTLQLTVNSPVTFNGAIDGGSNGLTLLGPSVLTLGGNNTFTGTTTVNDGTLRLNSADTALSGNLVVAGGRVELLLSNQIDPTRTVSISAGSLDIGNHSNALGGVQLTGGSITGGTGVLTNDTTAFDLRSGDVSAILGGSAGLHKSTAGTVILSGTSSYGGPTALSGGMLQLALADALPTATAVTLSNTAGTVLDLSGYAQTIGSLAGGGSIGGGVTLNGGTLTVGDTGDTTYSGIISGTGTGSSLIKQGTGTLTLTGSHTYEGDTLVTGGGTLKLLGQQILLADTLMSGSNANWTTNISQPRGGAQVNWTANGVQLFMRGYLNTVAQFDPTLQPGGLHITGNWSFTGGTPTSGSDNLSIITRSTGTPGSFQSYGEVTGGIAFTCGQASGNLPNISGSNSSFTISNVVQAGSLILNQNDNLYFDIRDDGQNGLSFTLTNLTNGMAGSVTATRTDGTATNNLISFYNREQNNNLSLVSNVVIASGGGSNVLPVTTALTVADFSTLDLGGVDQQVASLTGPGTVTNSGPKDSTLTLNIDVATPTPDFSGNLTGAGANQISLLKAGLGTQLLSGTNTYTGTTTVAAGTLALGAVASISDSSGVTLATGAVLDASAKATFTIPATQTLTFHVDGTDAGSSGQLRAAALDVTNAIVGFSVDNLLDDAAYVLADYATLAGPFASVVTPPGYAIDYAYSGGTQIALVRSSSSAYETWANGFTSPPLSNTAADADPDHDGHSNLAEFAFDGDPRSGANDGKVVGKVATLADANKVLTLTLPVRSGATFIGATRKISAPIDGIVYTIEGSDTLDAEPWSLAVTEVTGPDATAIQAALPAPSAGWTYRTFRSPGTVTDGDPRDFLRANVTQP